jgi:hypothetical protein
MSTTKPTTDSETIRNTPLAGPMSRRSLLGGALAAGLGVALVPKLATAAPGDDEACAPEQFLLKKKMQEHKKKTGEHKQKSGLSGEQDQKKLASQKEELQKQGYSGADAKPGAYERHRKRATRHHGRERDRKAWRKSADGASNVPLWLDINEKTTLEGSIAVDSITTPEYCGDLAAISFTAEFRVSEDGLSAKELIGILSELKVDEATGKGQSFYAQFGDKAEFAFLAELLDLEYSYTEPTFLGSKGSFGIIAVAIGLNTSKEEPSISLDDL